MRTFTDPKTLEALADTRYEHPGGFLKNLNVHPRDWFESFAHTEPIKYRYQPVRGPKSEFRFYPHYTKDYGWEWMSEERFIYRYGKNKITNENMVVG